MSKEDQRIEVITGTARQRRWSTEQKRPSIEENFRSWEDDFFRGPAQWRGAEPSVLLAALNKRGSRCGCGIERA